MTTRLLLACALVLVCVLAAARDKAGGPDSTDVAMLPPPRGAMVLFDGRNLSDWKTREGRPAPWKVRDGYMEVASTIPTRGWEHRSDLVSLQAFKDFQLHVEFWLPSRPDKKGQARANSGVYLQGRYEIQVLDSYGEPPQDNGCGAIYKVAAPLVNASKQPQTWQSYDIAFRAPRFDPSGKMVEKARITVFHNGVLIQNNQQVAGPTGGGYLETDLAAPGPVMLQDHGDPVRYRNIWVLPFN